MEKQQTWKIFNNYQVFHLLKHWVLSQFMGLWKSHSRPEIQSGALVFTPFFCRMMDEAVSCAVVVEDVGDHPERLGYSQELLSYIKSHLGISFASNAIQNSTLSSEKKK